MKLLKLSLIATISMALLATAGIVIAKEKPIPNQDNVSVRAADTVSNPKNEKQKQSAAAKRAQLRKDRDALKLIKIEQQ